MTKIKNTKKGMAKKTLSMSLVVAMLATSNVPVWAAEFSDGTDAAVATEAPAAETFSDDVAEAPAVETDTDNTVSATSVTENNDVNVELEVNKKTVTWGESVKVTGTITSKDGKKLSPEFRWLTEDGTIAKFKDGSEAKGSVITDASGKITFPLQMTTDETLAGKTLTLYLSESTDGENGANYDIATNITLTINKKALTGATYTGTETDKEYTGYAQTIDGATFDVKAGSSDVDKENYTVTPSNATKVGDEIKATITANADSPFTGSIEVKLGKIKKRTFKETDIVANTTKGQTYQYTGDAIKISKNDVTLKESTSTNNGQDDLLSGADLSKAITVAQVEPTKNKKTGEFPVTVYVDKDKFDNITVPADKVFYTEETVNVKKRDLSAAGTKITVNTLNGKVPTGVSVSGINGLIKYLSIKGVEGSDLSKLNQGTDYELTAVKTGNPTAGAVSTLADATSYTVTIKAIADGNCEKEQTFQITTAGRALTSVTSNDYEAEYTGDAIQPSKTDLGTLTVTGTDAGGNTITEQLPPESYEIIGYSNNVNACTYNSSNVLKKEALVNIKINEGNFANTTCSLGFTIKPLTVTAKDITVPASISINKRYTKASEYQVPVTVVAKNTNGKTVKTLSTDDYTVKYDFVTSTAAEGQNDFDNYIRATVTVKNTNYILGTSDGKTVTITKGAGATTPTNEWTKIVAKKLTDSMVVVTPSTYTYTGGTITPTYAVIDGSIVLYKKGEIVDPNNTKAEYKEVSISDAVNVGTGKITVEGINNLYSGRATGTFTITPANTSDVKITIKNQGYTGKQIRPRDFTATLNGNNVTDQFEIVSYGENKEAGKGTVVLKPVDGNKNFTGDTITAEFNIIKEKVVANLSMYDKKGNDVTNDYTNGTKYFEFDGNEHTFAKVLLSDIQKATPDGINTTAKASDFEIKYVDNISGNNKIGYVYAVAKDGTGFSGPDANNIVTADGTVITGVVAKRAFTIESVKFDAKNVTIKNATYAAGLPVKPEVLIQIGGSTLVEGKDYTIKYVDKNGAEVTPTEVTNGAVYGVIITGKNGYVNSSATSDFKGNTLCWGVDKKNLKDCNVTVKDGVVTVLNGYIPVASTEYTSKNNGDGTYTVTAASTSKNYTGSITVTADGKAADEKPDAPMISNVKVVGNKATVILSGEAEGASGYDYVISTDRDCITNKDYTSVNKNQVQTSTTFKYVQQGTYYAYCHAWKRDANGKKVFSDWSNAYPFVVSAITPDAPVITNVKVSGSTIKVTYKAAANATGYDVVLGTSSKKENGETRPYHYGDHKVLNLEEGTVTATFKKVPKGTWVVGMHAFNRTSEDGKKVFSPWSNLKKATVK